MVQKWEYMTWLVAHGHMDSSDYDQHRGGRVKIINGGPIVKDWTHGATLDAWLKQAGSEGWELVQAYIPAGRHSWSGGVRMAEEASDAFYIFKRPMS